MPQSRRRFLAGTGVTAIAYKLAGSPPPLRPAAPNDQVGLGFIGVGIRGTQLLRAFKNTAGVRIVAAADLYDGFLQNAKEVTQGSIATTKAYEEILSRRDVDAVVIATPDHWHRRMVLDALSAGKHVYIEKPMTWSIPEGAEVMAAVRRSGRMLQVGSGAGSTALAAKAKELLKSGAIGKVSIVRMSNHRNNAEGAWVYPIPPDASPGTIDWDRFHGPAPKRPFDPKIFFRWRCWWEYSGGVATDLYVHMLTALHEVMDVRGPLSAVSSGGIYRWNDGRTVPDVMSTVYEYAPGWLADVYVNLGNSRHPHGTLIMGSEGTLAFQGFSRLVLYPEPVFSAVQRYATGCWPEALRKQYLESVAAEARPEPRKEQEIAVERGRSHQEQFVRSLRDGTPPIEDAVKGHYAAGAAHLANLAYRKGRRMNWNLETGKVRAG